MGKKLSEKFEKITRVRLPFDLRHTDAGKNYGIHGLEVCFILVGKKGATQFMVHFPVFLPHVQKELDKDPTTRFFNRISGFDVGYHALTPQYEDQRQMDCDLLPDGKCYYDGSGLQADQWVNEIFSIKGKTLEDEIWNRLEIEYTERFET